jgi:hypothetical protein
MCLWCSLWGYCLFSFVYIVFMFFTWDGPSSCFATYYLSYYTDNYLFFSFRLYVWCFLSFRTWLHGAQASYSDFCLLCNGSGERNNNMLCGIFFRFCMKVFFPFLCFTFRMPPLKVLLLSILVFFVIHGSDYRMMFRSGSSVLFFFRYRLFVLCDSFLVYSVVARYLLCFGVFTLFTFGQFIKIFNYFNYRWVLFLYSFTWYACRNVFCVSWDVWEMFRFIKFVFVLFFCWFCLFYVMCYGICTLWFLN